MTPSLSRSQNDSLRSLMVNQVSVKYSCRFFIYPKSPAFRKNNS